MAHEDAFSYLRCGCCCCCRRRCFALRGCCRCGAVGAALHADIVVAALHAAVSLAEDSAALETDVAAPAVACLRSSHLVRVRRLLPPARQLDLLLLQRHRSEEQPRVCAQTTRRFWLSLPVLVPSLSWQTIGFHTKTTHLNRRFFVRTRRRLVDHAHAKRRLCTAAATACRRLLSRLGCFAIRKRRLFSTFPMFVPSVSW
eukprot:COSAG06_NODE_1815_length_8303_cov_3.031936_12_plen_200_part_00